MTVFFSVPPQKQEMIRNCCLIVAPLYLAHSEWQHRCASSIRDRDPIPCGLHGSSGRGVVSVNCTTKVLGVPTARLFLVLPARLPGWRGTPPLCAPLSFSECIRKAGKKFTAIQFNHPAISEAEHTGEAACSLSEWLAKSSQLYNVTTPPFTLRAKGQH